MVSKKPGDATLRLKAEKRGYLTPEEKRAKKEKGEADERKEKFNHLPAEYERKDYGSYDSKEVKKNIDAFNNSKQSKYWYEQAEKMKKDDRFTAEDGTVYSKKDCYVKALNLDEKNALAWGDLALLVPINGSVIVNQKPYLKQDCYVKSLSIDQKNVRIWLLLGSLISSNSFFLSYGDTPVMVNGEKYFGKDCYVKALSIDERSVFAWLFLASALGEDERITVNGKQYSAKDCYVKSLSMGEPNPFAWGELKELLKEGETVEVNGKTYAKDDIPA
jgi:phosphopantetheinyl transferase (holo-ACP synthase)